MGVNTYGFVMTEEKDPFVIYENIEKSLFELMKTESGFDNFKCYHAKGFSHPTCTMMTTSKMILVSFKFKGEDRDLTIHFDCDSDGENCGYMDGSKIILSFGAWGNSVELMRAILEGLRKFGDVYLIPMDSNFEWSECKI